MRVLLTGATGFIGRRLYGRLVRREDIELTLLVRDKRKLSPIPPNVRVIEGDTFNIDALHKATSNIDVAYYLIHSMRAKNYDQLDKESAKNFLHSCISNRVEKIIYLGGLGEKDKSSLHLRSRIEVGEILSSREREIKTIWFRAGMIIGAGSASFEIVRHLTQKIPIMITPKWVRTKTQPISVNDVIDYLETAIWTNIEKNEVVDIGADLVSFEELIRLTAKIMGLRRLIIPVPLLSPRLSSYWLILFTPVPYSIAGELVEGLRYETTLKNSRAKELFPQINPTPIKDAIIKALDETIQSNIISRWCDSTTSLFCDISQKSMQLSESILTYETSKPLPSGLEEKVFKVIKSLGGDKGWYKFDFLWHIRGLIDKLFGGYGINRGRRDPDDLRVGDALDWWKVIDIIPNRRLLLYSQMKNPGEAWLEFLIEKNSLKLTAYFNPKGLLGILYWRLTQPFHYLVFNDLIKNIVREATNK